MESITLLISVVGALLVFVLRHQFAFLVYVGVALFYPKYLVFDVGTLDVSAIRVLGMALLLRCLLSKRLRNRFVWNGLDKWVTVSVLTYLVVSCLTIPLSEALEGQAGLLNDTWIAYIATRLCIKEQKEFSLAAKGIGVLLVPLALLGLAEAFTSWQPYLPLTRHCPWRPEIRVTEPRSGLNRAVGPFGHPILFGCCFAMFFPLIYWLRREAGAYRFLVYILCSIIILGALSSMSGGSWGMLGAVLVFLAFESKPLWVKPVLKLLLIQCVGIALVANRPVYYIIFSYLNPVGGAWWHRAKLIDCAIASFGEWYLLGYKGEDPGWGQYLGMRHTDVTNQFILNGVRYGIVGILVLCVVLVVSYKALVRAYRRSNSVKVKSACWALGCSLSGVIISWTTTAYFSQMLTLFYVCMAMIGSVSAWCPQGFRAAEAG